MTKKKGFQASIFKGNYQKKLPNFKLRPIIAEPIQKAKSLHRLTLSVSRVTGTCNKKVPLKAETFSE
jgi:hypothetical protein